MTFDWVRVETIPGYERTYQSGAFRVAYQPMEPGQMYMLLDLFIDGVNGAIPLPPAYIEGLESLSDDFYMNSLRAADWHIVATIEKL